MTQETTHPSAETPSQVPVETGIEGETPTPVAPPPKRRSIWPGLLLALFLVAASSGITYLVTTGPEETTTQPAASEEAEPAGVEATPPPIEPGEEPVADAAARILPSVVQIRTPAGVGSGVIYDSEGLILTAAHVVAGQETVTVRLESGEQIPGTVLGGTSDADVAVIKVDRTGLSAAELALGEEVRVGQMAIAVGSPWGLEGTVTAGIVSAVDQTVPQANTARALLQTDAAINPGNSGGPLVDRYGRVLGINVSIFSLSGANDGVGFAVPIDVANEVAQRVVAGEVIETPFLGVSAEAVETGRAGALISEVVPGSAAEEAGIQVGDLIVSLGGAEIQDPGDLAAQVRRNQPGDPVEVVLVRDGAEITIQATLGIRPADGG